MVGDCQAGEGCETIVYSAVNGKQITSYRAKFCPGQDPVYYDKDNVEVDVSSISGTLVPASDVDVEKQIMCDGTNTFVRWFVYVTSDPSLNFSYDTTLEGLAYTPAGDVRVGECNAGGDGCETILYSAVNGKQITPYRVKFCPGQDPVYYDQNNAEVDVSSISGTLVPSGDVDVEKQIMCDGTNTFVRWFVYVASDPSLNFSYDTTLEGTAYTPAGAVTVGDCRSGDGCETILYSAVNGKQITPYRVKFCPGQDPVYYDQNNAEVDVSSISGTLVPSGDVDVEKQIMCDGSTTFIRWFVYVTSDPSLNFSYDTTLEGAAYTPAGDVRVGECTSGDCETILYSAVNGKQITPYRVKFCPGQDPVYYDKNNAEVDVSSISGTLVPSSDVDVEKQIMCDGTTTFVRWFVYVASDPSLNFSYDTTLEGAAYTPSGIVTVGDCKSGDDCETILYSAVNGTQITPYRVKFCPGEDPVYYDQNNAEVDASAISGTLVPASDIDVERQIMCDGTTTFVRWFVYVASDPSLNFSYDTTLNGAAFTPSGDARVGDCRAGDNCDTQRLYQRNGDSITPFFRKICPGATPIYYDVMGIEIDAASITGEVLLPEDVDAEEQLMCDGEDNTFIRWFVLIRGKPTGIYYDTDLTGALLDPAPDPEKVTVGICPNCPVIETIARCDIDPGTRVPLDISHLKTSGERKLLSALDGSWSTYAEFINSSFRFRGNITWEFSTPVNVEFTIEHGESSERSLTSSVPLKVTRADPGVSYNEASNTLTIQMSTGSNPPQAVVLAENITTITFLADDNSSRWFMKNVSYVLIREPIPFLQQTETSCEGVVKVSHLTLEGEPYQVEGEVGDCNFPVEF